MALGQNNLSGKASAKAIESNSLWMQYYQKQNPNGRKSMVSSEFMDMSRNNLIGLTLVDKSLFILIPVIYPEIYMFAGDEVLRKNMKGCLEYITQVCRAVNGIPDQTIDVQTPNWKTQFFTVNMYTILQQPINEVTLSIPADTSGYFVTNMIRHWLNAMSDEYTRYAHYNGLTTEYNNWSHSCAMAYIKPNKNLTRVDYGALWYLMVPKGIPTSNFNADATAPSVAEFDLTFGLTSIDFRNLKIKELLESLLAKYRNYIVMDSCLFGTINDTYLSTPDEINPDAVFQGLAVA